LKLLQVLFWDRLIGFIFPEVSAALFPVALGNLKLLSQTDLSLCFNRHGVDLKVLKQNQQAIVITPVLSFRLLRHKDSPHFVQTICSRR
jgi:hypothetical protein